MDDVRLWPRGMRQASSSGGSTSSFGRSIDTLVALIAIVERQKLPISNISMKIRVTIAMFVDDAILSEDSKSRI